jgi:hypothetical protein
MPPKIQRLLSKIFLCNSRADQTSEFTERENWAPKTNGEIRSIINKAAAKRLHRARAI